MISMTCQALPPHWSSAQFGDATIGVLSRTLECTAFESRTAAELLQVVRCGSGWPCKDNGPVNVAQCGKIVALLWHNVTQRITK